MKAGNIKMNKTGHKVFLSYSHKDKEIVNSFMKAFDQYGISYQADQQIRAGENWMKKIERALQEASIFVLFLSPDFLTSAWAMFEIGHAISRFKEGSTIIVPVMIRNSIVPDVLHRFMWIDARSTTPEVVAQELKKIVDIEIDSTSRSTVAKRSNKSKKRLKKKRFRN